MIALAAGGCVSLRPYSSVVADIPAAHLFEIHGMRVHAPAFGTGEPLLLLHGFGESTLTWEPVIGGLARQRRVVAVDLYGFGWTQRPRAPSAYTLEGQAALVLGLADRLGFASFDLAGHSYGGALALFLAARHPDRVRSLVLIDSALPAYATLRREKRYSSRALVALAVHTFGLSRHRIAKGLRASYFDDSRVTPELVTAYADRLRVEGAVDAFYGLSAPNGHPPDVVDLATLAMPALLVWGAEDRLTLPAAGRSSASQMPDARFVELAGCGHSPMEECPELLLEAIEPFLGAGSTAVHGAARERTR